MTDSTVSPADLDTVEYRLDAYESLLESFQDAGYEFTGFDPTNGPESGEILLRHDVDLSVDRALAMAECEHRLGVQSTYCVLACAPAYDLTQPRTVRMLQRITKLGHDIALHFDPHAYWKHDDNPDSDLVAAKVDEELTLLGRLLDREISTASFHMPPPWVLDRCYEPFVNTYAPAFFSDIEYFSDSSQKWTTNPPFPNGLAETFQLLVHPGLWAAEHRPMAEIVSERCDERRAAVDHYFAPLKRE